MEVSKMGKIYSVLYSVQNIRPELSHTALSSEIAMGIFGMNT